MTMQIGKKRLHKPKLRRKKMKYILWLLVGLTTYQLYTSFIQKIHTLFTQMWIKQNHNTTLKFFQYRLYFHQPFPRYSTGRLQSCKNYRNRSRKWKKPKQKVQNVTLKNAKVKSDMLLDNIWATLPLVVQLDRIHGSDPWGRGFESLRAGLMLPKRCPFFLKVL